MMLIAPQPLTHEAFRPFGDVIEMDRSNPLIINQGFTQRFNDLANVDVEHEAGGICVSLFLGQPRPQPIMIKLMERHPLGSQLFMPMQDRPWLVLVAGDVQDPASYRAFTASGRQGVNYARNVWHHPLLVLDADSRFLIIDRQGPGNNLEEVWFAPEFVFGLTP
ncbi:ureidoglycolate lyase [Aestuariivirga sp.]|jgi:ureidoglycolate lyase|uniref:ureidoglycolate lyase n=1 Tax=Aestuariivirga sp. TaxID=2650926 RepID=UPI0037848C20